MAERLYCKIEGTDIPLVSTGVSPFAGAGQFGKMAQIYRKKFLFKVDAMLKIMEACYEAGGRGTGVIPFGKINKASKIMKETYNDYVITGSTLPGPNPGIEELIELEAKIIYVHGSISDSKNERLTKLLDEISSRGIIPGIATHNPISTIQFAIEKNIKVKSFLIPFNIKGMMMGVQRKLEDIVDNCNQFSFMGMKTLAAGKLEPQKAYDYISKHNIHAVVIGMVEAEEAKIATEIALKALQK
ncbi:hypothetical protein LCGC14_1011680 [marine sediment metagenome]|uniref:Uncharacterized protein n=1 Tax=marine sediment metagenome TaxID=412755 RepID=A0A0F9QIC2_9ZZZZ|nr:hypothetical protein [archaeon]